MLITKLANSIIYSLQILWNQISYNIYFISLRYCLYFKSFYNTLSHSLISKSYYQICIKHVCCSLNHCGYHEPTASVQVADCRRCTAAMVRRPDRSGHGLEVILKAAAVSRDETPRLSGEQWRLPATLREMDEHLLHMWRSRFGLVKCITMEYFIRD